MVRSLKEIKIGQTFNSLTAIKELPYRDIGNGKHLRHFRFRCICGKIVDKDLINVTRGSVKSCGCHRVETNKTMFTTHGLSEHPLRGTWKSMVSRCYNKKDDSYQYYGGRGIAVCDEWLGTQGLINFVKWGENKYKPGLEIDRKNNNDGYSPNNCRFVTKPINMRNRSSTRFIKYKGKDIPYGEFHKKYVSDLNYSSLAYFVSKGYTAEKIVEKYKSGRPT